MKPVAPKRTRKKRTRKDVLATTRRRLERMRAENNAAPLPTVSRVLDTAFRLLETMEREHGVAPLGSDETPTKHGAGDHGADDTEKGEA